MEDNTQSYDDIIMDELMNAPGTAGELAMVTDISPKTVKKILSRLENNNLVECVGTRGMCQSAPMYAMKKTKKTIQ